jgi:hypothetical protein
MALFLKFDCRGSLMSWSFLFSGFVVVQFRHYHAPYQYLQLVT